MNKVSRRGLVCIILLLVAAPSSMLYQTTQATSVHAVVQNQPAEIKIAAAPIPMRVLMQSPAATNTELQVICLFESAPQNALRGSLTEINEKLSGLLDQLRKPSLFRGELGETALLTPRTGTISAKRLLVIGLGDSQTFTPQRMELVGTIVYNQATRLGIAHPFFAPTILDGGVTRFTTGEVSQQFVSGFLRAARTGKLLVEAEAGAQPSVQDLTYLAGPTHSSDTQQGIERAAAALGK